MQMNSLIRTLPEGFSTSTPADVRLRRNLKTPYAKLNKNGTLTLSVTAAARFFFDPAKSYVPVRVAYNKELHQLAIQKADQEVEFPTTARLTRTGAGKNLGVLSFKFYAENWGIIITGRWHPAVWDPSFEALLVDLKSRA
jgi:hypothetical protein